MASNNTAFRDLVSLCEKLEATAKKLEKTQLISDFLHILKEEEILPVVLLIVGRIFPDTDPRTLEVSWRTIQRVKRGLEKKPPLEKPLTILEVHNYFAEIAAASGRGSRQKKETLLTDLFARLTPAEERYAIKIIFGEMQHGVSEGVMMQAIAQAVGTSLVSVRRACMFTGDLGEVARVGMVTGKEKLERINLQLFWPIQPMLAELAEGFTQVFTEHRGKSALEYKFDGARVQIHKQGEKIKIYSRHLSDVTDSLPEIVELMKKEVKARTAIIDGEVIAVGDKDRPLPFQELMRRFRRVHNIAKMMQQVPVKLYLFDLIYVEGNPLIDTPYQKRWEYLSQICNRYLLTNRIVTDNQEEAERFLKGAMKLGHEGLMAKSLESTYPQVPGAKSGLRSNRLSIWIW